MKELLRTTNPALLSFAQSLLEGAGIVNIVTGQHTSAAMGSLADFPSMILVDADFLGEARKLLTDAGLAHELGPSREGR